MTITLQQLNRIRQAVNNPFSVSRIAEMPSGGKQWRILSHLTPNYLSLLDAEVLRGTLSLYDWTDGEMNRRRLNGIQKVSRKGLRKVMQGAVERGVQIEATLDTLTGTLGNRNLFPCAQERL